jgi:hypothetical protein
MTNKTFYVYTHNDPRNKATMYVGIGQYDRAWSTRRNQRKERHVLWLEELYSLGFTLADIVQIEVNRLTKEEALECEAAMIMEDPPEFNELGNPNHWQRGRKYDKETAEFAKSLHDMGYGYIRIATLMGGNNKQHMKIKRMIENVK